MRKDPHGTSTAAADHHIRAIGEAKVFGQIVEQGLCDVTWDDPEPGR